MSLTDWSEVARNFALMIGAGFASYAAYYGAKSWKRQTQFSRKFEVTLELLRSASWLQRSFELARTPMDGLSQEEIDNHGLNGARRKRATELWVEFLPSVRRYEDALIDARIFLEDDVLNSSAKEIRDAISQFRVAIHFEVMEIDTDDPDLSKRLRLGRYDTGEENPATRQMRSAVEHLISSFSKNLSS